MITAKILADSINPYGVRLTTFLLTYPRFIHSEFMTHRCFSRNAASSRAIPIKKMVKDIQENPAWPEFWAKNQKGMAAMEQLDQEAKHRSHSELEDLLSSAINSVEYLSSNKVDLHKGLANRYLEPWAHITVVATTTEAGLHNFFAQRAHPAAMPEFQVLAYRMLSLYLGSTPISKQLEEWHIPRFEGTEALGESMVDVKIATARCARTSYLTFDGTHDPSEDVKLHDKLAENNHWSPFEHCAQVQVIHDVSNFDIGYEALGSSWQQYRKFFNNEMQEVDLTLTLATKPAWITL